MLSERDKWRTEVSRRESAPHAGYLLFAPYVTLRMMLALNYMMSYILIFKEAWFLPYY